MLEDEKELISEIERLRKEIADLVVAAGNDATAFKADIERLRHRVIEIIKWHRNDYNGKVIDELLTAIREALGGKDD